MNEFCSSMIKEKQPGNIEPRTNPEELLTWTIRRSWESGKTADGLLGWEPGKVVSKGLVAGERYLINTEVAFPRYGGPNSPAERFVHLLLILQEIQKEGLIQGFDLGKPVLGGRPIDHWITVFINRETPPEETDDLSITGRILKLEPKTPMPEIPYQGLMPETIATILSPQTRKTVVNSLKIDQGLTFAREVEKEIRDVNPVLWRFIRVNRARYQFPFAYFSGVAVLWKALSLETAPRYWILPPITDSTWAQLAELVPNDTSAKRYWEEKITPVYFTPESLIPGFIQETSLALNMNSLHDQIVWKDERRTDFYRGCGVYLALIQLQLQLWGEVEEAREGMKI